MATTARGGGGGPAAHHKPLQAMLCARLGALRQTQRSDGNGWCAPTRPHFAALVCRPAFLGCAFAAAGGHRLVAWSLQGPGLPLSGAYKPRLALVRSRPSSSSAECIAVAATTCVLRSSAWAARVRCYCCCCCALNVEPVADFWPAGNSRIPRTSTPFCGDVYPQ